MDYRKYGENYYIRLDKGDKLIDKILDICKKEKIASAIYSGIGACESADIQTFIPEKGNFELKHIAGMLELVSLTGNIITDKESNYYQHAHAVFSYKKDGKHQVAAGHIKSITISYTAEIELRPVIGGKIQRKFDSETGTGFWAFEDKN
ncbi:MAG: DNA-binding protein [Treponema sp.]|nr:DNA-binding protein [Treponema sp.]